MKKSKLLALFAFIGWISCVIFLAAIDMRILIVIGLYQYSKVLEDISKVHKDNNQ